MLKSIKNLLIISALGIATYTSIYATEQDSELQGKTVTLSLPQPKQDIDYIPFIKGLYDEKKWDEIINNADKVQTIIKNSYGKTLPLSYDTIHIIGQAYFQTQNYKKGMEYFNKLTGLLSERDKGNSAIMIMAYKTVGLNVDDQTSVPPAVLGIAHAWMATHLWETMYNDMLQRPNIASELKEKYNWQVVDNFKLAFLLFPQIDSFFNSTAAYFYLANGMYKEADEQFRITINKLKEEGNEPNEGFINDAAEAHEKAQQAIL